MAKIAKIMVSALTLVVFGAIFASSAFAESTVTVSPIQYSQGSLAISETETNAESSVTGKAMLNGKVEVRAIMPHGLPKSERDTCKWADFAWSDWETSNGGIVWAPAGHHGWTHACLVHGVWRQIGGGPGQWNCGNVVKPIGAPLPPHAVKVKWSEIVVVKHFTYTVNVKVQATLSQTGSASAECSLNGAMAASTISATGTGTATASAKATAKSFSKAVEKAKISATQIVSKDETKASMSASAKASVSVALNGQATAYCASVTPGVPPPPPPHPPVCIPGMPECTPPPVEHWTAISCTGFEEISGGASFLVDCGVSDDNGAQISLAVNSNNGNSRVSGINCFSNGGSQTCPSGGTFEFRVSGINSGSSILYSSITATASANGVPATFTSDPFPVDPADGGFSIQKEVSED